MTAGLKVDTSDAPPASNAVAIRRNGETVAESPIRSEGYGNPGITLASPVLTVSAGDVVDLATFASASFATSTTATFLAIEVVEAIGLTTTLADLGDIDLATAPPVDGATLVWDQAGACWRPGPSLHNARIFVTLPSAQAVPANAWTKLAFSTEFVDTGGHFDPALNLFTAPVAGPYLAVLGFTHQDTSGTPSLMPGGFGINGASPANYARSSVANPVSLASQLEFTTILPLNVGDTVAGMVYLQGAGASIPGPNLARMAITRLP